MNRRDQRGSALHLLMIAIVAVFVAAGVATLRIEAGAVRFRKDERRIQALWLARSAVRARRSVSREVRLGTDLALIRVNAFGGGRFSADVTIPGHGAAHAEATFAPDGRILAFSDGWRGR